ncbi:MAG TPA: DUF501 domain-containing protein, partial [Acidimicrobiales bacterium]|nr:DUF501 domain-containing protein [Acidimicrobiales bacterium]
MTVAAVVLAAVDPRGAARPGRAAGRPGGRPSRQGSPLAAVATAAGDAGLDEVVVVVGDEAAAGGLPDSVTVLLDEAAEPSECSAARVALDWCGRQGHLAGVVAVPAPAATGRAPAAPAAATDPARWRWLAQAPGGPVVVAGAPRRAPELVRLDAAVWPLLPLSGELAGLWRSRPELVSYAPLAEPTAPLAEPTAPLAEPTAPLAEPTAPLAQQHSPVRADASRSCDPEVPAGTPKPSDVEAVAALLGRRPAGAFSVAVRDGKGGPVVIENAPLLDDGTPMPTRWWLVGRSEREAVSRLESAGGVAAAEAAIPAEVIAAAHGRYAAGRDALLPPGHAGPRPSGGVGGTKQGVKCLHAHLAAYLAGDGDPVGRWTAGRLAGVLYGPVAAVDCGTNSTRLLVAGPDGSELDRRMTITRLGEGVDEHGHLGDAAIERTLAVLAEYREAMDRQGVVRARATATSAARDADNAGSLLEPAGELLGTQLEVLSGEEEGNLSYDGATAGLDPAAGPYLVVDLGGGSTELITRRRGPAQATRDGTPAATPTMAETGDLVVASIDAGCVRMTERFLQSDPPLASQLEAAREAVTDLVAGALASAPDLGAPARFVGVAGTVTSLAALHLGLERYDPARTHHSELGLDDVEALLARLAALPAAERRRIRPLEPGRADVIVGGAVVLAALMTAVGQSSLLVSEHDGLD